MSTASLSQMPYFTALDDNGVIISGAKIWTYAANSSTLKETYVDYNSGTPASNPIVCDSAGRCELWLSTDSLYKLTITDDHDNLIRTVDNVGTGQGSGVAYVVATVVGATDSLKALAVPFAGTTVIALSYRAGSDIGGGLFKWAAGASGGDDGETIDGNSPGYGTAGRWKRVIDGEEINPQDWGCYGNGSDPDQSYLSNAITYAQSVSKALHLSQGNYNLTAAVDFKGVPVVFDPNAKFTWTNFTPDQTAIIGCQDLSQHYSVGTTTAYTPKFAAGTVADPHWFGAKSDGVTADEAFINQAIKSVSYNSGYVQMDGTYAIFDEIIPCDNVTIQGQATISPCPSGMSGAAFIGSGTVSANNLRIKGLTIDGGSLNLIPGVILSGDNNTIEGCTIKNCGHDGIRVGSSTVAMDQTNVSVRNNIINDCGGTYGSAIAVMQGENVTIENNIVKGAKQIAVVTQFPIENVIVRENSISGGADIEVDLNASANIKDVTIDSNNILDGHIRVLGAGNLSGQMAITNNNINDSTGVEITLTDTDICDIYTIANNNLNEVNKGILLDSVTRPMSIFSNSIEGNAGADCTGIIETNVSDASYSNNLFNGIQDWYAVSRPRYVTLGTSLRSEIDAGTISDGRFQETDGSNVVTASTLTLPSAGNVYHIADAVTAINLIESSGWQSGSTIKLICDSTCTINHNASPAGTAYPVLTTNGAGIVASANDIITLTLDGTRWLESGYVTSAGGFAGTFVMTLEQLRSTHWTPWPFDATCTYRQQGKLLYIDMPILTGTSTSGSNYWDFNPFVMKTKVGAAFPFTPSDAVSYIPCIVQNQGGYQTGAIKMDSTRWTMFSPDTASILVTDEFGTASGYMGWPAQTIVFTVS